ncbi:MAG: HAD-IA family hydrolase [Spirochaetota bacterium]
MKKAVIFDFDGTLADTYQLYVRAFLLTLEDFYGKPLSFQDLVELRPRPEKIFFKEVVGEERFAEIIQKFLFYYEREQNDKFEGLYPGIVEVVSELRQRSLRLGIVTTKSREAYQINRRITPELGEFDLEYTFDEVTKPKPHPQALQFCLEKWNISKEECLFIGDTMADYQPTLRCKMDFGAALWSKNDEEERLFREQMSHTEHVHFFRTPADILQVL